jgi:hypothetical protein
MDHSKNHNENPAVSCDVKNCSYHDSDDLCSASKIKVGPTFAVSSTDTVCDTFRPKGKL